MRYPTNTLLAIALAFGLIGLKTLSNVPGNARGADPAEMVDVVAATRDILPMSAISEAMVAIRRMPRTLSVQSAFGSQQEVVGRVAKVTIPCGSPIAPHQLAPKGTLPGLACVQSCGLRAIWITVECDRDAAQWFKSRTHVDVVAMSNPSEGGLQSQMCQTILRDVEVLALEAGFSSTVAATDVRIGTVTVAIAVLPKDLPRLHLQLVCERARLRLTPAGQPVSSQQRVER